MNIKTVISLVVLMTALVPTVQANGGALPWKDIPTDVTWSDKCSARAFTGKFTVEKIRECEGISPNRRLPRVGQTWNEAVQEWRAE